MVKLWSLGLHLVLVSIVLVGNTNPCLAARNKTVGCSEQEALALLKFKHTVLDKFRMLSSWVGNDCCRWERIICDDATGNVVRLHLRGYVNDGFDSEFHDEYLVVEDAYLVGDRVSSSLAELTHLEYLDLSGNIFQGVRIPEFIGSLKQLRYLNLSNAGLSGIIPHNIGNLSNIKVLDLGLSSYIKPLTVDDMTWLSGLSSLEYLNLNQADLSGAKNLDTLLYTIPSLLKLGLSGCRLSNALFGPHVNSSRTLLNIKHLDLSINFFEGQLPSIFQNMTSLSFLDLSSFNLSLAWNSANLLNMFPSLYELHLLGCGLQNTFLSPSHFNFTTHSNIQHLDLRHNLFEGRFPFIVTNISSLRVLELSGNSLSSSVPVMPSLLKLDLSFNNFTYIEHIGIWSQCHLKQLKVSYNRFALEMIGPSRNMSGCSEYALEWLYLDGCKLKGSIPESLGRLVNLKGLDLSFNDLTGPIPESLGRLKFLQVLDLSSNNLRGPIPTFLGQLTRLVLFGNLLNGSIPESLGRVETLTYLRLESNQLTGPIPASLGRLSLLHVLLVHSNFLNGTIPVSIGGLTKLQFLDVSNNSLEGVVSEAHFANISMLKYLDATSNYKLTFNVSRRWLPPFQLSTLRVGSCKIVDDFPRWLQTQWKLEHLMLSNTSISGTLPKWLRKMPINSVLDLSHNNLSGPLTNLPFVDRFNALGNIHMLFLQNNLFNESIPSLLCKKTDLEVLDLSGNWLTGKIPRCLQNLLNLKMILLSSNDLSGAIPSFLGHMSSSLRWLKLNDNNFNGEIPQDLGNLGNVIVLDLGENKISGNIPEWIGKKLTNLVVLVLHKNNFTGTIPQTLCKSSRLQILDVAQNSLVGPIPRCFGDLIRMIDRSQQYDRNGSYSNENLIQVIKGVGLEYTRTWPLVINMDLSSNELVGEIPQELTSLAALLGLNLSHNHLTGGIPVNIGNMKALFSLDFSENELTGMIPPSIATLNFLSHLNLSYNNFSGRIPTGNQLQTLADPSIYAGNKDLCGPPLQKNCNDLEDPTTSTTKDEYKEADEPKKVWTYLDKISGFAAGFWVFIGVLVFKKQWRHKLFTFVEVTIDNIHVAVAVKIVKMKRGREAI